MKPFFYSAKTYDKKNISLASPPFFLFLEAQSDSPENLEEYLKKILEKKKTIVSLSLFERETDSLIKESKLLSPQTLSIGHLNQSVLYLKTMGSGAVYLLREGRLTLLMQGNAAASGYVKEKDVYVFTSSAPDKNKISAKDIENLKTGSGEIVMPMLLVELKKEEIEVAPSIEEPKVDKQAFPLAEGVKKLYGELQAKSALAAPRKKITFIILIILFIVFIWSVVLGYQRRVDQSARDEIRTTKESVTHLLTQAEQAAFLDPEEAMKLIQEAKNKVAIVEDKNGKKYSAEILPIKSDITEKEAKITKREEKKPEEFFNFTIDSKEAEGSYMSLNDGMVSVIDKTNGVLYSLSLEKKSLDKKNFSDLKNSMGVSSYDNLVFFLVDGKGIYKFTDGDIKQVIPFDKDWGEITSISAYNGNIYLLDKEKNDIWKYIPTESGYGDKTSYFKGTVPDIGPANSLTIDGSLYIGLSSTILKYTGGLADEFKIAVPQKNIQFTKIFSSKESEQVYAWNKNDGTLILFTKEGSYVKTVSASVLKNISDFVVYQNSAYVLLGSKLMKVDLSE